MQRRNEETQARLVLRNAYLNNWRHIIAVVHEMAGSCQSLITTGEKDRDHATPNRRSRIKSSLMGKIHEEFGVLAQPLNAPALFLHQLEGSLGCGRNNGGEADTIDKTGQRVAQPTNHLSLASDKTSARSQSLRQSADNKIDLLRINTGMLPKSAPIIAKDADRMRLVDQQPSLAPLLQFDEADEVCDVAIHAVETLSDNEGVAVIGPLLAQKKIEMVEVVVTEDDGFSNGRLCPAHDAVVRQLINKEGVMGPKDMRDRRHIRQIAADESKRRLHAEELCKSRFQSAVQGPLAADKARSERADLQFL